MEGAFDYAPAIALFPLVAFVVALAFGKYMPKKGAIAGIAATAGSLLLSLWMLAAVASGETYHETLYTWAVGDAASQTGVSGIEFTFGILIDPLAALMLVIVSLVAFLVHVFSLGYMNAEGETGLPRYYAGLGLFTFSMLAFVYADNLLMAFMFFELVGLCSFLLIGFWFRTKSAPSAAKKAFLVTRFGDYFFLLGVVAIGATFGTLQFAGDASFVAAAETAIADGETLFGFGAETWVTITGLLVLGGVIGKSAQFPLHTWLPDAMEGPTTVSALIHAATMVAAGVYLVARMFGYYALSPTALAIIAFVGGFTALFAATMGVVKDDIKQVLAYSTISQYGYMMLGLGVGGYVAGVFHLMNHAFFKALLFLGAGAVIVLMHHEQDMWKMGGLKDKAPITYYTFLAGALALAGIIPFSGFWSKDEILFDAMIVGVEEPLIMAAYAMGLLAVFFTGFYTFRMVFLTFHGEPRSEAAEDPHPVGWSIKAPLIVLGVLALVAGIANLAPVAKLTGLDIEFLRFWLDGEYGAVEGLTYGAYTDLLAYETGYIGSEQLTVLLAAGLSLLLAFSGAGLAWKLYNVPEPVEHKEKLGSAGKVVEDNYYQDEYQVWLAEGVTLPLARAADRFDQTVIDGVVNGVSTVSLFGSNGMKRLQTGIVTNYAALLVTGLIVLLLVLGFLGGWFI
ncbi:NADH-quinone oxidoreductase subunit L [Natrarchaeobaculum sulfurireducens]|uniref:NADH dehydrogenase subunit L n=1 Tax=Natrarchaeobaculum sulfurireducens TaxID=2044521 RepID=A0A346PNF3_9EURY|nr:NADH-quinone oxidoreductase subunit L [Natrarchaeobaculum sulfurireducens]AXR78906.1 NADH dehydrogenase subunit L [Natrarchaeobaculum sulfurireducens]AXR81048.1 NADH-ubiquinone oxidoreductase chain L [Natrarchaeobaculum sulfurireducens]